VLFVRALLAFLILPAWIAFAIPLVWLRGDRPFHADGLWVLVPGVVVLLECVREFYVNGKGTLAPWDPPRRLVTTGLYRWSRNPMYVGVLLTNAGWAVGYRSWMIAGYAGVTFLPFHLRVLRGAHPQANIQ
jgi:protein-S-isoprenylcysteine O-methyltransferase Ste14